MTRIPSQSKDDFEHFMVVTQADFFDGSQVNHALTTVAQEVAELIKQAYLVETDSINHTLYNCHSPIGFTARGKNHDA